MNLEIPIKLTPVQPKRRRLILRIVLTLEALGCSFLFHTRGSLIPIDIFDELGLYNSIMTSFSFIGILGILTWLVFYYWEWIMHDHNQWEFRQSIPELEHAIKALTQEDIEIEKAGRLDPVFRSPEDSLRIDLLFAKLERMDLSRPTDVSQTEYLTKILDCAHNKTYKQSQYYLMDVPF